MTILAMLLNDLIQLVAENWLALVIISPFFGMAFATWRKLSPWYNSFEHDDPSRETAMVLTLALCVFIVALGFFVSGSV